MTLEVEVGGSTCVVTIEPSAPIDATGARFRVTLRRAVTASGSPPASEVFVVDARRTDLGLSLLYPADARSIDVAVTANGANALVQLPHVDVAVVVDGRRYGRRHDAASETGDQRVTAPMPGRILRVLVAVGDEVSPGQAVVVIEAMKMENDLKVVRAGCVREVLVTESSSVEAGRLLIVVE